MNILKLCIIILFIVAIILAIYKLVKYFMKKNGFEDINTQNLENIPKVIHKVYIQHSGKMTDFPLQPKELQEAHNSWKIMNPGYEIKYYSMEDCREYLKKHFEDTDFLQAFDCLNAYAFKCDFFRYCVVYNEGGWYSDWKQVCLKKNLLDELDKNKTSNIVMCWDRGIEQSINEKWIQNCFFGSISKNLFLKECINEIINNIKYKYYGNGPLHPTGPGLLGKMYKKYHNKFSIYNVYKNLFIFDKNNKKIILHKCNNCGYGNDWKDGNNYYKVYENKEMYKDFIIKDKIPKIIHKTGPQSLNNLSPELKKLFDKTIKNNPEYQIKYYDDNDCYNLIKNNFEPEVLQAYETLIPTAYKADLFRYCVLYLYGGIYSDLSQNFFVSLNDIIDFEKDTLILCKDRYIWEIGDNCIQISFICSIPKFIIFKNAINEIIKNCKENYYGKTMLSPTGPCLFYKTLKYCNLNYIYKLIQSNSAYINLIDKNIKIIKIYSKNHSNILYNKNNKHYGNLWNNKNIYKNQIIFVNNRSLAEFCNVKPNNIISDTNFLSNEYDNIKDNDKIFVVGTTFKKFKKILDNKKLNNLTIIISATDIGFPQEQGKNDNIDYLKYIENSNKIKYVYTSNYDLNIKNSKIFPIPLGLDYHTLNEKSTKWGPKKIPKLQENDLLNIYNNSRDFENRENKIYSFFHLNVNPINGREHTYDRIEAKKHLENNSLNVFQNKSMNRNDTWKEMSKYKWIASPHGNGLDCHRTYEAIALGCIPIVKTSTLDLLYKNMPIIICNDWSDLNLDFLNKKTEDALKKSSDKIKLIYWKNIIFNNNNNNNNYNIKVIVQSLNKKDRENIKIHNLKLFPHLIYYNAINGYNENEVKLEFLNSKLKYKFLSFDNYGTLANFLTKVKIIKEEINNNTPYFCIIEDDLKLKPEFINFIEYHKKLSLKYNMLRLDKWGEGYIFSLEGAKKVLNLIYNEGIIENIDNQLRDKCGPEHKLSGTPWELLFETNAGDSSKTNKIDVNKLF